MGLDAMILVFWMLSFKPAFLLSFFTFIKRLFISYSLFALGWYYLHIWGCWFFSWQFWFQFMIHPAWHFAWCTLHVLNNQGGIYSLVVLLSQYWTSPLVHVRFCSAKGASIVNIAIISIYKEKSDCLIKMLILIFSEAEKVANLWCEHIHRFCVTLSRKKKRFRRKAGKL